MEDWPVTTCHRFHIVLAFGYIISAVCFFYIVYCYWRFRDYTLLAGGVMPPLLPRYQRSGLIT